MWEATVQGRTVGNIRGTGRNGIRRQPSLTWRPAYPGWRLRVRWPTRPGTHLPQITSSSTAGSWLFIQHGSYQWINSADQPHVQEGQVILYRGIHREETFRYPCLERDRQQRANQRTWNRYLALQWRMLSDSSLSFNTIHDWTKRCETAVHVRHFASMSSNRKLQRLRSSVESGERRLLSRHHDPSGSSGVTSAVSV